MTSMRKKLYIITLLIPIFIGISILFAKNNTRRSSYLQKIKKNFENNKNVLLKLDYSNVATSVGANSVREYYSTKAINQEPKTSHYKMNIAIGMPTPNFLDEFQENNNGKINKLITKKERIKKLQKKIAYWAEYFLKHKIRYAYISGRKKNIYRDCSFFVRAAYWKATGKKIDLLKASLSSGAGSYKLRTGVQFQYAYFKKKKRYTRRKPQIGDVIFFDNTYDKNRNRRRDDWLTHVGILTQKRKDGTFLFVHGNASRRIKRGYINIKHRSTYRRNGKILNTFMRRRYRWEGRKAKVMTGDLARGFGGF